MADEENKKKMHEFGDSELNKEVAEYKYSIPLLMEAQVRKLRLTLDNWREIVLFVKSILLWEKPWHPTALLGGATVVFMLLWLFDPSVLTVVAIFGLVFTICDYFMPYIASNLFKHERWSARKEKEFEDVLISLVLFKAKLEVTSASFYNMKSTNPKFYYFLVISSLCVLAWLGCNFNNLFLAFVTTIALLLFPGMEHNGVVRKWTNSAYQLLNDCLDQARTRVGQNKKEN